MMPAARCGCNSTYRAAMLPQLPTVVEVPYEGVEKLVKQTGVDMQVLDRMLKIATISMNPGTQSEGENAARALESLLRKYNIERAAVLALAGEGDVLREAGRFYVVMPYKRRVHAHFQLARGVCALFNTAWCHMFGNGSNVRFVFVGSAPLAHGAARLFAELYVKSAELIQHVTHKKAFLEGIADGFYDLSHTVRAQRQKYYERIKEEAAVRERMANDIAAAAAIASVKAETAHARTVKTEEVEALLHDALPDPDIPESEDGDGYDVGSDGDGDGSDPEGDTDGEVADADGDGPSAGGDIDGEVADTDGDGDDVEEVEPPPCPVVDLTGPDEDAVSVMQNERDDVVRSAAEAAIVYSKKRSRALLGYADRDSEHYRAGKRAAGNLPTSAAIGGA